MDFETLLQILGDEVVFETGLLLAGDIDPTGVHRQLSRWVSQGRVHQMRRGLYALAPPYRKVNPHPFRVANRMVVGSYVSCQSALAYYDLIPEYAPTVVSVAASRPNRWDTSLGRFIFRHIKSDYIDGYRLTDLGGGQDAFVATPEKAILDLVYLTPRGDSQEYLSELRLQNLEMLDEERLEQAAKIFGRPKLERATNAVRELIRSEGEAYERERPS
jgi:predicted transcriptional regulator of viral defense system